MGKECADKTVPDQPVPRSSTFRYYNAFFNKLFIDNQDRLGQIKKKLEMCPWDTDAPAIAKFI